MKAAVLTGYDKNGRALEIRDVPMPEMKDNDVLVKIHTAGVNPLDNMIIRGEVKMIVPFFQTPDCSSPVAAEKFSLLGKAKGFCIPAFCPVCFAVCIT